MKKKAQGKSQAKRAKPAPKAKAKAKAKAGKAKAKPAKSAQAAKPARATKAKGAKAKPGKAKPAAARPPATRAKAPKAKAKAAPAPKARPGKASRPSAPKPLLPKVAPKLHEDDERDTEVILAPELISKTIPETVPSEDEGALRNVMSSLTAIFGGRDQLSDAEIDALLDSKMASGEIPPSAALDPLDEAQSIIYEAWNSEGPQRVRLAHKALELSPDCADAYVILAEEDAKDRKHALELFRKGVEAGERALDPEVFRRSAGRFWEVMETRPYMRARLGLAECLWDQGRKEEALGHLRELMRLNPADDQGVRYILAQCLLETGEEGELGALLERFRDDASPQIRYSHALWMFRHEGRGRKADELLAEAIAGNPHVPAFILKRKKPPKDAPESAEPGSEEEAGAYAMGAAESWQKTLGALDWLAEKAR